MEYRTTKSYTSHLFQKYINVIFLLLFISKYLAHALSETLFSFKLPYLIFVVFLYLLFSFSKYMKTDIFIQPKQLFIFFLAIVFYASILLNLKFDSEIASIKSQNMAINGFFYINIPFLILLMRDYPCKKTVQNYILFLVVVFMGLLLYKLIFFIDGLTFTLSSAPMYFHSYFSLYDDFTQLIGTNHEPLPVSIFTGRLVGIFLLYAVIFVGLPSKFRLFLFVFLIAIMILIGNRGSILAVLVILFFLVSNRIKFIFLIIAVSYMLLSVSDFEVNVSQLFDRYTSFNTSGRWDIYKILLNNIDVKNVFGEGLGSFYKLDNDFSYPHNIGLEILYELGFIPFLIYVVSLFILIFKISHYNRFMYIEKVVFVSLWYYLIVSQFSADLYMNINVISLIILFFMMHYSRMKRNKNSRLFTCFTGG
jgi:hypothetical protein